MNLLKTVKLMLIIKMLIDGIFYIIRTKAVFANMVNLIVLYSIIVATNYTLLGCFIGMFFGILAGVYVQFCIK